GGMDNESVAELKVEKGSYQADEETVRNLINIQNLNDVAFLHKLDVTKDLGPFLDKYKHLQFKIVFLESAFPREAEV
ncbi:hypothetical protein ABTN30_20730, partial [Acinetobacter baumannii]